MSSLFGVELPTPVNFVIAFVFVLLLIGAAAWLVRRFGATRIDAAARGRQPRLAVIDSAAVDGRRKLVIIRRDNVEHLLMIGGPSDVVVETNIVRGTAAADPRRDRLRATATPRPRRARMPLPDPTPWPLQPEPVPRRGRQPARAAAPRRRAPRAAADEAWQRRRRTRRSPAAARSPRSARCRPADTLAGLADELGAPGRAGPRPRPVQPPAAAAALAPPPTSLAACQHSRPAADQSLAEMAQRLEAALRRPTAQKVVAETQRVTATRRRQSRARRRPPRVRRGATATSRKAISSKKWRAF